MLSTKLLSDRPLPFRITPVDRGHFLNMAGERNQVCIYLCGWMGRMITAFCTWREKRARSRELLTGGFVPYNWTPPPPPSEEFMAMLVDQEIEMLAQLHGGMIETKHVDDICALRGFKQHHREAVIRGLVVKGIWPVCAG